MTERELMLIATISSSNKLRRNDLVLLGSVPRIWMIEDLSPVVTLAPNRIIRKRSSGNKIKLPSFSDGRKVRFKGCHMLSSGPEFLYCDVKEMTKLELSLIDPVNATIIDSTEKENTGIGALMKYDFTSGVRTVWVRLNDELIPEREICRSIDNSSYEIDTIKYEIGKVVHQPSIYQLTDLIRISYGKSFLHRESTFPNCNSRSSPE